jgi:hypothetical protein
MAGRRLLGTRKMQTGNTVNSEESAKMNENQKPRILIPWSVQEAITVTEAAKIAGCSLVTIRTWAHMDGLGRRVGGRWMISKVALSMFLDGDKLIAVLNQRQPRFWHVPLLFRGSLRQGLGESSWRNRGVETEPGFL